MEKATSAWTPFLILIENSRDAIIKITACAICGSDLHLLDGYQPTMESGDILGHENMGEAPAARRNICAYQWPTWDRLRKTGVQGAVGKIGQERRGGACAKVGSPPVPQDS